MNTSYRVHVADQTTGREAVLSIIAPDSSAAAEEAQRQGWLVSRVEAAPTAPASVRPEATAVPLRVRDIQSAVCWGVVRAFLVLGLLAFCVWVVNEVGGLFADLDPKEDTGGVVVVGLIVAAALTGVAWIVIFAMRANRRN